MKRLFLTLFTGLLFTSLSQAQNAPQSPLVSSESANVKISYSQPSKRDREIFGGLVPFGQVWRTGANMGTEVTFAKDVKFGDKAVKAGTYTLFSIPGKEEWTVILNPELKQMGSSNYDKIKDKNVAEVKVKPAAAASVEEKLLIGSDDKSLTISWDKTKVSVPLKF